MWAGTFKSQGAHTAMQVCRTPHPTWARSIDIPTHVVPVLTWKCLVCLSSLQHQENTLTVSCMPGRPETRGL